MSEYKGKQYELKSFNETYNGVKINNPTNNPNAKYYLLYYKEGCVYLQTHKPFVSGFEAITDANAEEVIHNHIDELLSAEEMPQ